MKNPIQITRKKKNKIVPYETAAAIGFDRVERELMISIAGTLEYPDDEWAIAFEKCKQIALDESRRGHEKFSMFCLETNGLSILGLQELYTRTFDLNPVCALEIGYHLFGEDYKRGEFLARLRETEDQHKLGQDRQLPDYLPVVLRLLSKLDDPEMRAELIGVCLIPALEIMNTAIQKKEENPYRHLVGFVLESLKDIADRSLESAPGVETARYQYV